MSGRIEQAEEFVEIDLERLVGALWRSRGRMVVAAVLAGLLAFVGSLVFLRGKYETKVLFYADGVAADVAMVLAETGETLDRVCAQVGGEWSRKSLDKAVTAKLSDGEGYFAVMVVTVSAGEGKKIADAMASVLPERMAKVIPNGKVTVADAPVLAEKTSLPHRGRVTLAGALLGAAAVAGDVGVRVIFGRKKRRRRR